MKPGRHFLHIPGPSPLPEAVAAAMARPTIDHRGPEFGRMTLGILERLKRVGGTGGPIAIYPSSATGAWEAALVNTLSPGDRVLFCQSGQFASLWSKVATRMGFEVEVLDGEWRRSVDAGKVAERLADDPTIKAVALVHNETSTGVLSDIAAVRRVLDESGHEALLLVDAVSSLGAAEYCHDEWGVDVTVVGGQKGLMLPPGLGFNFIGPRALEAYGRACSLRAYWDWGPVLEAAAKGFFPYTPATNLLFGLEASLELLLAEGLDAVFARHRRLAAATRAAVAGWGLEVFCLDESAHSPTLTAVLMPEGQDADALRGLILERFDLSLGTGLGQGAGRLFRIGHLGSTNELMLCGALCGVEMGLRLAGVPHSGGGVQAAMEVLGRG